MNILITGINGQDGSNMAKYILNLDNTNKYKIFGTIRDNSNLNNINDIVNNITIFKIDFVNDEEIENIFKQIMPDIIFHFASAQPQTEKNNYNLYKINTLSTLKFLECIHNHHKKCKFLSAGSSMEFTNINNENTVIDLNNESNPNTIYGISKMNNNYLVKYYRDELSIFAIHVILFSHESSARNEIFLTKKIAIQLNEIKKNIDNNCEYNAIEIGNINSVRDWSDSNDFVEAMWLMINANEPKNYILSSNTEHTVKDYIDLCCKYIKFDNLMWKITDNNAILYSNNNLIIKTNKKFYRPNDFALIGNNLETIQSLNWKPKITFEKMVENIINDINNRI